MLEALAALAGEDDPVQHNYALDDERAQRLIANRQKDGSWVEVGKGRNVALFQFPDMLWIPSFCVECIDFVELMNANEAMPGIMRGNKEKLIYAFRIFHHYEPDVEALAPLRGWAFIRSLQKYGWPKDVLRRVAEIATEAGL